MAYFPSWTKSDRIKNFVEFLRDFIKYKVNLNASGTLYDTFRLAINFESKPGN
jgi:hypothetical protein